MYDYKLDDAGITKTTSADDEEEEEEAGADDNKKVKVRNVISRQRLTVQSQGPPVILDLCSLIVSLHHNRLI